VPANQARPKLPSTQQIRQLDAGATGDGVETSWQIRVLYDGECPLCSREVRFLARRDGGRGRLQLEDIAAPDFEPGRYGLDAESVMARIHGVLPDGRVVEGVEVFRRAYAALGLGWLVAPTRWPLLRPLFDAAYRLFARNRLRWTGRDRSCAADRCTRSTPLSSGSTGGSR
jgi:predicted DCC family thiol-disulfide oxidoreductase YuxK